MTHYKWLTTDHRGIYGHGNYSAYLPKGKRPGEWLPKIPDPAECVRGYHTVTLEHIQAHLHIAPATLFEVDVRGASSSGVGKTAWEQIRLVRAVGTIDLPTLTAFAADCAEHVLSIFEGRYPSDDRPRKAIEAARTWAKDPTRNNANAANAAAAAAYAAYASAAAANAAAYAAYASAAAANAAAAAAAERKWQSKRLLELVSA